MAKLRTLHIGVSTYQNHAERALPGAARDAVRWRNVLRELFGERVVSRLLVPLGDLPEPERATASSPSKQAILEALRAEAAALGDDDHLLVTYSGHGAADGNPGEGVLGARMILCPTDVGAAQDGHPVVVHLQDIVAQLGDKASATTLVIDACFVASSTPQARNLGLSTELPTHSGPELSERFQSMRVLLACQPWESAVDVQTGAFGSNALRLGAFTFALTNLLKRWSAGHDARDRVYVNVDYGTLVHRAHELLEVLNVQQRPVLLGPAGVQLLPVFHPELGAYVPTSAHADRFRPFRPFGADAEGYAIYQVEVYATTAATWVPAAAVFSTGDFQGFRLAETARGERVEAVAPNTDYWFASRLAAPIRLPVSGIRAKCLVRGTLSDDVNTLPSTSLPGGTTIEWIGREGTTVGTVLNAGAGLPFNTLLDGQVVTERLFSERQGGFGVRLKFAPDRLLAIEWSHPSGAPSGPLIDLDAGQTSTIDTARTDHAPRPGRDHYALRELRVAALDG